MAAIMLGTDKMKKLGQDCKVVVQQEREGCGLRTILKDMYCSAYVDKTENIGYVMADKVIDLVGDYHREVSLALEDEDGWYEETIQKILKEKEDCAERCNTLYKLRVKFIAEDLSALKGKSVGEAYLNSHLKKSFTKEEASVELEEKLMADLKNTVCNNRLFVTALNEYAGKGAGAEENTEHMVVKYGEDGAGFKAVLAMKAYLETGEDGYLRGVMPEDASLKDITYSVCAGADTMSMAAAAESGEIEESMASKVIRVIGMVLGAAFTIFVAGSGGYMLAAAMGGGILAILLGAAFAWTISDMITDETIELCGELAVGAKELVCLGARCICKAGKMLYSGLKKLVGFIGSFFSRKEEEASDPSVFKISEIVYTEPASEVSPVRAGEKAKASIAYLKGAF